MLAAAGCKPPPSVLADAPGDVAYVAVVTLDASGRFLHASRLAPWNGALSIFAPEEDAALVVGYAAGQLAASPTDAPLVAAEGCAARLPPPRWVGRWREADRVETVDAAVAPALGAPWLEGVCPSLDPLAASVDVSCEEVRCPADVKPVGGDRCGVTVDLTPCALPAIQAALEPSGALCKGAVSAGWNCTSAATATLAAASERCASAERVCDVDVYLSRPAAPYTLARTAVVPGARPWLPSWLFEVLVRLRTEGLVAGYAWDLVVLGEQVVVASGGGAALEECTRADTGPSKLSFLAAESPATIRTTTAAPCLTRLAGAPGGFVATGIEGGRWTLFRYDAAGRVVRRRSADERTSPGRGEPELLTPDRRQPYELLVSGGRVLLLADGPHIPGQLFTYDLDTFAPAGRFDLAVDDARTMVLAAPDLVAIGDSWDRDVSWIDPTTGRARAVAALPKNMTSDYGSVFGFARAPDGKVLVGATVPPNVYVLERGGQSISRAPAFDRDLDPVTLEPWPKDPRLIAVAGTARTRDGSFEATLSFFDLARGRFRPGTWPVGHGIVNRLRPDAKGRLWALLPWSGEVVRITP